MAAGAPMIISSQPFNGQIAAPSLPDGQRTLQAGLAGAREIEDASDFAAQTIGGQAQQGGKAQIGLDQSVASDGMSLAQKVLDASDETRRKQAMTTYVQGAQQLYTNFQNSSDWQKAPQDFTDGLQQIRQDTFKDFGPQDQAVMTQALMRHDIGLQRDVQTLATSKIADQWSADYDQRNGSYLQRAATAPSPAAKAAVYDDVNADLQAGVAKGTISSDAAVKKLNAFHQTVDQSDTMSLIAKDPGAAVTALGDPGFAASLDPVQRQAYRQQAQARLDALQNARAGQQAQTDPAAAVATYGKTIGPGMLGVIYDKGVIGQESGGDPGAISPKGALGIGQLMPDTARQVATQLHLDAVANLSDDELKRELLINPGLNRQLGFAYFQQQYAKFGRLDAALAAYNAGPGNVQGWMDAAAAKFGPEYTPAQFASVIPIKETSAYIGAVFGKLGADPNRGGVSPLASYRIAGTVDGQLAQEEAQRKRDLSAQVQGTDADRDTVTSLFKGGYAVDPATVTAAKAPLIAAASAGDAGAAVQLRRFQAVETQAPIVEQAFQATPAQLEGAIAQQRSAVAAGGPDQLTHARLLDTLTTVQSQVQTQAKTDPIGLAERGRAVPVTQVAPPQAPDDPNFANALATRLPAATGANQRLGGPDVAPLVMLKPQETAALQQQWGQWQPDQKAAHLESVARVLPEPAYRAYVGEIAGNDQLAATAGLLGRADPQLGRDILDGQAVLAQKGVKPKAGEIAQVQATALPADIYGDPATNGRLRDAALAAYAAGQAKSGLPLEPIDSTKLATAFERVAGKVVTINGARTAVPPALEWQLREGVASLDQTAIDRFGGAFDAAGKPIDPAFLAAHAQLLPRAPLSGDYTVAVPGAGGPAPVLTRAHTPLVLNANALFAATRRAPAPGMFGDWARTVPGL